MRLKIDKIIIHCSDTPNGREHNAADIHRWHKQRGWDGIGYHYVIKLNGIVEKGRPEYWQGAHASEHNANSIGICLIGRDIFKRSQMKALKTLISDIMMRHNIDKVCGHYELDHKKTCPNFDVKEWLQKGMPV